MTISVAHIDVPKKTVGFVSDAEDVGQQLAELRHSDIDPLIMATAKQELNMPSPGVADQSTRYLDLKTQTLLMTQPAATNADDLLHEGKHRYKPVQMFRFDSLYE